MLAGVAALGVTTPTYADVCNSNASAEVKAANGCNTGSTTTLDKSIADILSNIIAVCGLVAVVFIVIGGIQYMTSSGDSGKTKKAKDTILYACIGLIICALAFAIVNFVITNILKQ